MADGYLMLLHGGGGGVGVGEVDGVPHREGEQFIVWRERFAKMQGRRPLKFRVS